MLISLFYFIVDHLGAKPGVWAWLAPFRHGKGGSKPGSVCRWLVWSRLRWPQRLAAARAEFQKHVTPGLLKRKGAGTGVITE